MGEKYRKVYVSIWNDIKFRGLSDAARLSFLFILTHPTMTSIGALRHTVAGLEAELGLDADREKEPHTSSTDRVWIGFSEACRELKNAGFIRVDARANLLTLPQFMKYNLPENWKVAKGFLKAVAMLPECELLNEHWQRVRGYVEEEDKAQNKTILEVLPLSINRASIEHRSATDLQEPRTKSQEPRTKRVKRRPKPKLFAIRITKRKVKAAWNMIAEANGLNSMISWGKKRTEHLVARISDKKWKKLAPQAMARIPKCSFLLGENERGWKIDIDFFLKPDTVFKIMEGKYDDHLKRTKPKTREDVQYAQDRRAQEKRDKDATDAKEKYEAIHGIGARPSFEEITDTEYAQTKKERQAREEAYQKKKANIASKRGPSEVESVGDIIDAQRKEQADD